jgi:hypothetical protein
MNTIIDFFLWIKTKLIMNKIIKKYLKEGFCPPKNIKIKIKSKIGNINTNEIVGTYDYNSKTINVLRVYCFLNDELKHIIAHEIAHSIYSAKFVQYKDIHMYARILIEKPHAAKILSYYARAGGAYECQIECLSKYINGCRNNTLINIMVQRIKNNILTNKLK